MNPFDVAVFHAINNLSGHISWADAILSFVAQYALEIYGLFFIAFWFFLPRSKIETRHSLVLAVFSGVLALLINVIISHIWARPRPFVTLPQGTYHQLIPHPADASFPSDHGSGGTAIASATWGKSKWVSRIFTIFTAIMLFSRIYTGVHWPTDILASIIVGLFSSWVIRKYSRFFYPVTKTIVRILHLQPRHNREDHVGSFKRL
ncbi:MULTISPECIES: phosphatase PAP2 family protein [unclassified Sporolactobacillus]|uniref:phosphatase PAP2 family protein n=1 Tax=unclassified Sporolactobacillus TaxID=2628533 RepID=UPI00236883CC|nr:phosphatase PAP2 family protein [Sporolactobacillus sp. CQH2019]MDD9149663.1 phosphatase PAP2 family protein [Sporolactobacillus sp. CQH2019]